MFELHLLLLAILPIWILEAENRSFPIRLAARRRKLGHLQSRPPDLPPDAKPLPRRSFVWPFSLLHEGVATKVGNAGLVVVWMWR